MYNATGDKRLRLSMKASFYNVESQYFLARETAFFPGND